MQGDDVFHSSNPRRPDNSLKFRVRFHWRSSDHLCRATSLHDRLHGGSLLGCAETRLRRENTARVSYRNLHSDTRNQSCYCWGNNSFWTTHNPSKWLTCDCHVLHVGNIFPIETEVNLLVIITVRGHV